MAAIKVLDLLVLVGVVCAELQTGSKVSGIDACNQPATDETVFVGLYVLTDKYFEACSPYKGDTLTAYLRAFVGGMQLYFQDIINPGIKLIFLGSRTLKDEEEIKILGSSRNAPDEPVKGIDALKRIQDLDPDGDEFIGSNKLHLVLTGHTITEEGTANTVNTKPPAVPHTPKSSGNQSTDLYDDYSSEVAARSASNKKKIKTVGGLSQFGSLCLISGAIVHDSGRNFSGVYNAALEVRNVLGPQYKGNLTRRQCSDDDEETFQRDECYAARDKIYGDDYFSCLNESIDDREYEIITPSQFFDQHSGWNPCSASYIGSQECTKSEKLPYSHRNCSISCCMGSMIAGIGPTLYLIPAPDGERCEEEKICVGGQCVLHARSTGRS